MWVTKGRLGAGMKKFVSYGKLPVLLTVTRAVELVMTYLVFTYLVPYAVLTILPVSFKTLITSTAMPI